MQQINTAMILAAGLGTRLHPLTNTLPKPLIPITNDVFGETLIERQIRLLKDAGCNSIIINIHHLAQQIQDKLKDGASYGVAISYSHEEKILGTGGGICTAIRSIRSIRNLSDKKFLLVSCDTVANFDYANFLKRYLLSDNSKSLGHIVLRQNPQNNMGGDFSLQLSTGNIVSDNCVGISTTKRGTFTGIAIFSTKLFSKIPSQKYFELKPILDEAVVNNKISGEWYDGAFFDCGSHKSLYIAREWINKSELK